MYVRICVCMCVRICSYLYVRICVCMYTRICVCIYVRICVCMYFRICVCMYVIIWLCMYVRMSVCVYVRICVCMLEYVYVCMSEYLYVIVMVLMKGHCCRWPGQENLCLSSDTTTNLLVVACVSGAETVSDTLKLRHIRICNSLPVFRFQKCGFLWLLACYLQYLSKQSTLDTSHLIIIQAFIKLPS